VRKEDFMEIMHDIVMNGFNEGKEIKSNASIGVVVDPSGNILSYFIGKEKYDFSDSTSDIEHHEARYRVNMAYGMYHAAQRHLMTVIAIKFQLLKRKHCE
jgi:hypothetical protein